MHPLLPLLALLACWPRQAPVGVPAAGNLREGALLPGIVADAARKTGFAKGQDGSVLAFDLTSGSVLWRARVRCRPLAVAGNRLLTWAPQPGQANALRLLWLAIEQEGAVVQTSEPVVLPDWVSVIPASDRSFSAQVRLEGGEPVFDWEARGFYAGGARPTSEILGKAKKRASGRVRLDPADGRILERSSPRPYAHPRAEGIRGLESAPYWTGSSWEREPLALKGRLVTFERRLNPAGESLTLVLWDPAHSRPLGRMDLGQGRALSLIVSEDRRHLFVHDSAAPSPQWRVHALPQGRLIARVPHPVGVRAAALIGSRVLVLVEERRSAGQGRSLYPRRLEALELSSGKVAWSLPLEPRVQGPPPR